MESERVDVEAAVGEARREVAEVVGERSRVAVGVDEDERAPGVDGDGHEAERRQVEARLAVGARRAAQRAVQPVRPGVVGALDRLAPGVAVAERMAAVPADVDEPAQLAVAGTREDDGERAGQGRRSAGRARRAGRGARRTASCARRSAPARARSTAGSAYQSYGSVRAPAIVATGPIYRASGRPPRRGGRAPARSASPTRAPRPWGSRGQRRPRRRGRCPRWRVRASRPRPPAPS